MFHVEDLTGEDLAAVDGGAVEAQQAVGTTARGSVARPRIVGPVAVIRPVSKSPSSSPASSITAWISSLGKPREAVQAAMAHVLFNVTGVLLFVGFCALLVVAQLLPAVMNLMGMTKNAAKSASAKKAHARN